MTAYLGRIRELRLGAYRLENVLSKFPVQRYATSGGRQGVLALGILERFNVIFDYPNER